MIKISRISSPLKDKLKNLETCSQLDGDGVFEGKYKTTGSILIRNKFIGELSADQIIVDENGVLSGDILYKQIAVFEGGIINVAGMKRIENKDEKVVDILHKVVE